MPFLALDRCRTSYNSRSLAVRILNFACGNALDMARPGGCALAQVVQCITNVGPYKPISSVTASLPGAFMNVACQLISHQDHSINLSTAAAPGIDAYQPHGTTVLCVRKGGAVVMVADGQITAGSKVLKPNARKLRRLGAGALGGFAGSTADGLTLFGRLESKLEEHPGQLRRAAVELAKLWRQDKMLRYLQATMLVADASCCLEVSGSGEVLEPADGVHAIGSGARFAVAAARALMDCEELDARAVAERAMSIAAERCVYTNASFVWEQLPET